MAKPYAKLPDGDDFVRLLHIIPANNNEPLVGELVVTTLSEAPKYAAISYPWGESDSRYRITVDGHTLRVRENCFNLLWQLRYRRDRDYIWIDAVCINQNDMAEKGHQVQIMGQIFQKADLVLACLGPMPVHCQQGLHLEVLQECIEAAQLGEANELFKSVSRIQQIYDALRELASRPYWQRLWIVQEFLISDNLVILYGEFQTDWRHLQNVIENFDDVVVRRPARIVSDVVPSDTFEDQDDAEVLARIEYSPLRINDILKARKKYDNSRCKFSLPELLRLTEVSQCSNTLDRIFGILQLLPSVPDGGYTLQVDYSQSPLQLAVTCVKHLLGPSAQVEDIDRLFRALRLTTVHSSIWELLSPWGLRNVPLDPAAPTPGSAVFEENEYYTLNIRNAFLSKAESSSTGQLTCQVVRNIRYTREGYWLTQQERSLGVVDEAPRRQSLQNGTFYSRALWRRLPN